jgi:hypothetical protein
MWKRLFVWYLSIEKHSLLLPITYDADELNRLQNFWNEYLRNLRAENLAPLTEKIADVIAKINHWLQLNTGLSTR